jgi:acetylglutamate kinase
MKKYIILIIILISLNACRNGVSKNELESRVKSDINLEFSKRATEANKSYTINSFVLVHKGGNEYNGILQTTEDGEEFTYEVNVTTDGDSYLWKIVE